MKIISATINNYRSIEELELDLGSEGNSYCRILAGINESGKSNVLKALSLLSQDSSVAYSKDINKKAKAAKKDITVKYTLDETSHQTLKEHLTASGVPNEIVDSLKIKTIQRVVHIKPSSTREDRYHIYLKDQPPFTKYAYSPELNIFVDTSESLSETIVDESEESVQPQPTVTSAAPAATPLSTATPKPTPSPLTTLETSLNWETIFENYYANDALDALKPMVNFLVISYEISHQ